MKRSEEQAILITGVAGLLGYKTAKHLLESGHRVIGVDLITGNLVNKEARLLDLGIKLTSHNGNKLAEERSGDFSFFKADIRNSDFWGLVKEKYQISTVLHLAVSPAVVLDLQSPKNFALNHFIGFIHVLDFCIGAKVSRLFYKHTLEMEHQSSFGPVDELFTMDNSIQWMNDHWATAYWELYQLQSMALELPILLGSKTEMDDLRSRVALDPALSFPSKQKYAAVEDVASALVELLEHKGEEFDQVAFAVGLAHWKSLVE
ncbi:MAG: NAD-dependent epimerase/dehydratase family protein [Flavobacteriales bacterium]|nr:NAD-dependent epimerase/dehydratase family protein [Flavobacteriales bacterium]